MLSQKVKTSLFIIVSVVILALLVFGIYWQFFKNKPVTDKYQAVFLTSGQVYFGKVAHQNRQFVTVTDIYYLRVSQPLQPPEGEENAANQPNLALIKLGNELHGPVDKMEINRDHILFIEDMKADSKVVEAISDYKKK